MYHLDDCWIYLYFCSEMGHYTQINKNVKKSEKNCHESSPVFWAIFFSTQSAHIFNFKKPFLVNGTVDICSLQVFKSCHKWRLKKRDHCLVLFKTNVGKGTHFIFSWSLASGSNSTIKTFSVLKRLIFLLLPQVSTIYQGTCENPFWLCLSCKPSVHEG